LDPVLLAFIGYILGAVGRTVYGFLAKILESDEDVTFDKKYYATMLSAIIISLLTATATFSQVDIPTALSTTSLLLYTFTFGYTANSVINTGISIITKSKNPDAKTPAEAKPSE
jgi:hypothetical protein